MRDRLERIYSEIQRTEAKLEGYKARLADLNTAMKQAEDAEIIRAFRTLKLTGRDLIDVLKGIQAGTVRLQDVEAAEDAVTGRSRQARETKKETVPEEGASEGGETDNEK